MKSPTREEFVSETTEHFGFLENEFGFKRVASNLRNSVAVAYRAGPIRIEVEGINWGFGVQVHVVEEDAPAYPFGLGVPFWAILKFVSPDRYDELFRGDQLSQIRSHAALMREVTPDLLTGDLDLVHKVAARFTSEGGFDV